VGYYSTKPPHVLYTLVVVCLNGFRLHPSI